jgi:putative transposase
LVSSSVAFGHITVRDLEPGHGRLLRYVGAPQPAMASSTDRFLMCYGTEFTSSAVLAFTQAAKLDWRYIAPGKPTQNGYIERFNRTVRHEWLDEHIFESIDHAQQTATEWLWRYNTERPNMAPGGITPKQKLAQAA